MEFARRRWTQAALGGVDLRARSASAPAPAFIYIAQAVLFFVPLAVGLPLVLVEDSFSEDWIPAIIFGGTKSFKQIF